MKTPQKKDMKPLYRSFKTPKANMSLKDAIKYNTFDIAELIARVDKLERPRMSEEIFNKKIEKKNKVISSLKLKYDLMESEMQKIKKEAERLRQENAGLKRKLNDRRSPLAPIRQKQKSSVLTDYRGRVFVFGEHSDDFDSEEETEEATVHYETETTDWSLLPECTEEEFKSELREMDRIKNSFESEPRFNLFPNLKNKK